MVRIITFCLLFTIGLSIQIPCQYVSTSWSPTKRFPLSDRQEVVSTKYGFDMIIDPIDGAVSKSIKEQGVWQPSIVHLAAHFLKPNSTVLNLGSQTGLQAIEMGNLIKPLGKLYIFEPYSVSYQILKKNIYLNDLEQITTMYQVGASDVQSQAKILVFPENTGGAEIFLSNAPKVDSQRKVMEEVVAVDLVDDVLPPDIQVDFVLMDVEKMEVEALLGMKKLIERSKDVVILLEWQYSENSKRNQAKTMRFLEWLKASQLNVYKYFQNKDNKCSIGTFQQIKDLTQLLTMPVLDILIFPSHIDPRSPPT